MIKAEAILSSRSKRNKLGQFSIFLHKTYVVTPHYANLTGEEVFVKWKYLVIILE